MSNILIAYFSRAGENYFGGEIRPVSIGNTKICAELLKESLDADAFEIEMKAPYSDNYDFSGKKILQFCTNEGSGMGVSEADIKKYAPGADVEEGLSVNGSKARESKKLLEEWVKK